jgi:adenylosuccinate lyase
MGYPQTLSPLDGRYEKDVEHLKRFFSEYALVEMRTLVETRYLIALSQWGIIRPLTTQEKGILLGIYGSTAPITSGGGLFSNEERLYEIEQEIRHDVKAVEYYLREQLAETPMADIVEFVHFGLTSEDVDNLAFAILFNAAMRVWVVAQVENLVLALANLAQEYKRYPMLGRTHGQPAVPTTLGKELINFAVRLERELTKLKSMELRGKLTGAVGNFNAHTLAFPEINWIEFSKHFVKLLGLEPDLFTTQVIPHDDLCEILDCVKRINSIIIGLDRDIWNYLSRGYLILEKKKGEVGSSTMPQKVNPIDFERSEGNLVIANGLLETLSRELPVNRLQRALADKYYLRVVGEAIGYSFLSWTATIRGLGKISANYDAMAMELTQHWETVAEGLQTVLRQEGVPNAYDLIKTRVRGRRLSWHDFDALLKSLSDSYPDAAKKMQDVTPLTYLGKAVKLTELALEDLTKKGYSIY